MFQCSKSTLSMNLMELIQCISIFRLIAAAPCIREQFWSLSKYVLGQLNVIIKARGRPISDNSAYQISIDFNTKQNAKHVLSHRSSKIDVFHNSQDG